MVNEFVNVDKKPLGRVQIEASTKMYFLFNIARDMYRLNLLSIQTKY